MKKKYVAVMITLVQLVAVSHYKNVEVSASTLHSGTQISSNAVTNVLHIPVAENARILTYNEALQMAINNNSSLQELIASMELVTDQRDTLSDAIIEMHGIAPFTGMGRGAVAQQIIALRELETAISNAPLNRQMIEDATDLTLTNFLSTIRGLELDLAMLDRTIDINQTSLNNAHLKLSLGMESETNVVTTASRLAQLRSNRDNLRISLQNQRLALNHFLGLSADAIIHVEHNTTMRRINTDLERHILTALNTAPSVVTQSRALDQARFAEEQHQMFSNFTTNPDTGEILSTDTTYTRINADISSASRSLQNSRNNLENAIRQTYNQLRQLEELAASLQLDLQQAQRNYNVARASYMAGMITRLEVSQAELGILNAEIALARNVDNYNLLLLQFQYAYLIA